MSTQGKQTLKEIQADRRSTANGAFWARAAYLGDRIYRGSEIWVRYVGPKQQEWAEYPGYESFDQLPIAERKLVTLWVADWLMVSLFVPETDLTTNVKEIRAAMNSLARLTTQLLAMKQEKKIPDLQAYLDSKKASE
jgi:hypothetical protein